MRIMKKGYNIRAVRVDSDAVSVDTKKDLDFVRNAMISDSIFKKYGGTSK